MMSSKTGYLRAQPKMNTPVKHLICICKLRKQARDFKPLDALTLSNWNEPSIMYGTKKWLTVTRQ